MNLILMILFLTAAYGCTAPTQKEDGVSYNDLSPDEKRVIENKGTERAFSGKYYLNKEAGVYL